MPYSMALSVTPDIPSRPCSPFTERLFHLRPSCSAYFVPSIDATLYSIEFLNKELFERPPPLTLRNRDPKYMLDFSQKSRVFSESSINIHGPPYVRDSMEYKHVYAAFNELTDH